VWPLLLHSTNRLAQQEQAEENRLSQEQVGCHKNVIQDILKAVHLSC
jgi:hypothetical protein